MIIEKKVLPIYFQRIIDGVKKYELRLADWECHEGDISILKEWDPEAREYTGRQVEKKISYVLKTKEISFWPEEDVAKFGYQIISFE